MAAGFTYIPTAPANWIRSPAVTRWRVKNGERASTESSIPAFSVKLTSGSAKRIMEPSAPLPTNWPDKEKPIASWNVRRRDSWASSPHSPSNRLVCKSSRSGKNAQHYGRKSASNVRKKRAEGGETDSLIARDVAIRAGNALGEGSIGGGGEGDGGNSEREDHDDYAETVKRKCSE